MKESWLLGFIIIRWGLVEEELSWVLKYTGSLLLEGLENDENWGVFEAKVLVVWWYRARGELAWCTKMVREHLESYFSLKINDKNLCYVTIGIVIVLIDIWYDCLA